MNAREKQVRGFLWLKLEVWGVLVIAHGQACSLDKETVHLKLFYDVFHLFITASLLQKLQINDSVIQGRFSLLGSLGDPERPRVQPLDNDALLCLLANSSATFRIVMWGCPFQVK